MGKRDNQEKARKGREEAWAQGQDKLVFLGEAKPRPAPKPKTPKGGARRALAAMAAAMALACGQAEAARIPDPVVSACITQAAQYHGLDPWLVAAVARTESAFDPKARNVNKNGSVDTGLMQINDIWIPDLAKRGITRAHLDDPCVNAHVGAWILAKNVRQHGLNWHALSAYNTGSPDRGLEYARRVYASHADLVKAYSGGR